MVGLRGEIRARGAPTPPRGAGRKRCGERRAKRSRWGGAARDPPNALGFPLTGNNYFGRRGAPPAQTGGKQSRWARHLRGTPGAVPGAVPLRSKNARRFFLCTPVGVQVPRACAAQHRLALLRLLPRCSGVRARTTPPTLSAHPSLGKNAKLGPACSGRGPLRRKTIISGSGPHLAGTWPPLHQRGILKPLRVYFASGRPRGARSARFLPRQFRWAHPGLRRGRTDVFPRAQRQSEVPMESIELADPATRDSRGRIPRMPAETITFTSGANGREGRGAAGVVDEGFAAPRPRQVVAKWWPAIFGAR